SLTFEPWPSYDPAKIASDTVEVVLQVNGKVRSKMSVPVDAGEQELERFALADENVRRHVEGKQVVKVIVVKNKLVNVVVR
ncbi:MAG: leucine--tRNA ligase, partial [Bacteroidetes bacterium]|nr:leucine--tRNA ligase [Bacteroidota bacterium]